MTHLQLCQPCDQAVLWQDAPATLPYFHPDHDVIYEMMAEVPAFLWTKYYELTDHAVPL